MVHRSILNERRALGLARLSSALDGFQVCFVEADEHLARLLIGRFLGHWDLYAQRRCFGQVLARLAHVHVVAAIVAIAADDRLFPIERTDDHQYALVVGSLTAPSFARGVEPRDMPAWFHLEHTQLQCESNMSEHTHTGAAPTEHIGGMAKHRDGAPKATLGARAHAIKYINTETMIFCISRA